MGMGLKHNHMTTPSTTAAITTMMPLLPLSNEDPGDHSSMATLPGMSKYVPVHQVAAAFTDVLCLLFITYSLQQPPLSKSKRALLPKPKSTMKTLTTRMRRNGIHLFISYIPYSPSQSLITHCTLFTVLGQSMGVIFIIYFCLLLGKHGEISILRI